MAEARIRVCCSGRAKSKSLKTRIKSGRRDRACPNRRAGQRLCSNAILSGNGKPNCLDRTGLILEIFSESCRNAGRRVAGRDGSICRISARVWFAPGRTLSDSVVDLGFVGGPGETQIEADRRAIDDQLNRLKRQLDKVVQDPHVCTGTAREKVPYPIVALVGYTNAGKSTIFNRLTGAKVMAKDMLFATLDPTMRAVKLPGIGSRGHPVGHGWASSRICRPSLSPPFAQHSKRFWPPMSSCHVRDISHPETEAQKEDVLEHSGRSRNR